MRRGLFPIYLPLKSINANRVFVRVTVCQCQLYKCNIFVLLSLQYFLIEGKKKNMK